MHIMKKNVRSASVPHAAKFFIQAKLRKTSDIHRGNMNVKLVTKHFQQTIRLYGTPMSIAKKKILRAILAMQNSKQISFRNGIRRTANKILLVIFNNEHRH